MTTYDVSGVIVHPDWKIPESKHGADISIIELKDTLDFDDYVQPICLAKSFREKPGDAAYLAGFGKYNTVPDPTIRYPNDTGKEALNPDYSFDDVLRENLILLRKWSSCTASVFRGMRHPENVICAGMRMRAARSGDSGGPLMITRKGTWFQVGIVSKGQDRLNNGYFTRVTAYCKWIKKETRGAVECAMPQR